MQTAKVGDTAQWISKVDGTPHLGDVIEAGETYADVQWRQNGRVERIRFSHPDGVTFESATPPAPVCWRAGDHWPHMAAVGPDCRTLPTDQQ